MPRISRKRQISRKNKNKNKNNSRKKYRIRNKKNSRKNQRRRSIRKMRGGQKTTREMLNRLEIPEPRGPEISIFKNIIDKKLHPEVAYMLARQVEHGNLLKEQRNLTKYETLSNQLYKQYNHPLYSHEELKKLGNWKSVENWNHSKDVSPIYHIWRPTPKHKHSKVHPSPGPVKHVRDKQELLNKKRNLKGRYKYLYEFNIPTPHPPTLGARTEIKEQYANFNPN